MSAAKKRNHRERVDAVLAARDGLAAGTLEGADKLAAHELVMSRLGDAVLEAREGKERNRKRADSRVAYLVAAIQFRDRLAANEFAADPKARITAKAFVGCKRVRDMLYAFDRGMQIGALTGAPPPEDQIDAGAEDEQSGTPAPLFKPSRRRQVDR